MSVSACCIVYCILSRQRTSCSLIGVDSLEQSILKGRKLVLEITGTRDKDRGGTAEGMLVQNCGGRSGVRV